jgi:hypothetical protein
MHVQVAERTQRGKLRKARGAQGTSLGERHLHFYPLWRTVRGPREDLNAAGV